jgi:hypothetical protein
MGAEPIYPGYWLQLLADATAVNSAPTLATHGVDIKNLLPNLRGRPMALRFRQTATGARTFTCKVWGYVTSEYDADGDAVASSAGWVDTGETYVRSSVSADGDVADVYEYLRLFDRLYIEVSAITGTATTINVSVGLSEGV